TYTVRSDSPAGALAAGIASHEEARQRKVPEVPARATLACAPSSSSRATASDSPSPPGDAEHNVWLTRVRSSPASYDWLAWERNATLAASTKARLPLWLP